MVQQENISLNESIMSEDNEQQNNDRELIAEFLEYTKGNKEDDRPYFID